LSCPHNKEGYRLMRVSRLPWPEGLGRFFVFGKSATAHEKKKNSHDSVVRPDGGGGPAPWFVVL
jgi:hypothetical protein